MQPNLILSTYASKRARETRKPYGFVDSDGRAFVFSTGGDLRKVIPAAIGRFATGQRMPPGHPARRFSTGQGCGCGGESGCPSPAAIAAAGGRINAALQRPMPGREGPCSYSPLSFTSGAVAAAGVFAIAANTPVTICPERLVLVTTGSVGFLITTLKIGNRDQFAELTADAGLHSALFAPDAVQVVPMRGDCADSGQQLQIAGTNLDGANPQTLRGILLGQMQGL